MTDRLIRWALAPPAFVVSAALWPGCVVAAYWHRTWADQFDDAALALAGNASEQDPIHAVTTPEPPESPCP